MGQVCFIAVIGFVFSQRDTESDPPGVSHLLTRIAFGLLVLVVPLAYPIRRRIFRGRGEGRPTSPEDYVRGTIVFLSMGEFVAMFALVTTFLHGRFFPPALVTLIAMIAQVISYPRGREMHSSGTEGGPIEPR